MQQVLLQFYLPLDRLDLLAVVLLKRGDLHCDHLPVSLWVAFFTFPNPPSPIVSSMIIYGAY